VGRNRKKTVATQKKAEAEGGNLVGKKRKKIIRGGELPKFRRPRRGNLSKEAAESLKGKTHS